MVFKVGDRVMFKDKRLKSKVCDNYKYYGNSRMNISYCVNTTTEWDGKEMVVVEVLDSNGNSVRNSSGSSNHINMISIYGSNDSYVYVLKYNDNGISHSQMGWLEEDLELIGKNKGKESVGKVVSYIPGTKIMDFVKGILKHEKDKERVKWLRTFERCVLPENVRELIEEAITVVLRKDVYDEWGINESFEKGLTNSILLYGPPGTGKTMVSESIAAILGKNLMKISSAELQSNVPGQTERNIQKSFEQAKKEDCVMLLDECDSVLYDRDSVGAVMSSEINALLTAIENYDGVIILTTNRLYKLDKALQRRIVAKVELPRPDKKTREEIWKKLMPEKMPLGEDLDYEELSENELCGGDIKNAILLAARKAIAGNRKCVEMLDFRKAVLSIEESKGDFEKNNMRKVVVEGGSISGDCERDTVRDKVKSEGGFRVG